MRCKQRLGRERCSGAQSAVSEAAHWDRGQGLQRRRVERLAEALGIAVVDLPVRECSNATVSNPVGQPWTPELKRAANGLILLARTINAGSPLPRKM